MKRKYRLLGVVLTCTAAYVVSYVVNSSLGGYWMKPERDTRDRYSFGLSMFTAFNWQPRVGYNSSFVTDAVGYFYAPLIRGDRWLLHPTHYLSNKDCFDWCDNLKVSDMHPQFRQEAEHARAKKIVNQASEGTEISPVTLSAKAVTSAQAVALARQACQGVAEVPAKVDGIVTETNVVTNPVDAVRSVLPVGWIIQRVDTNTYPSYRPKGTGTAIFLGIEGRKHIKQDYFAVVHIMPSDYRDGGEDPTQGEAQSWPARLIASTDNGKIYLWPGPQTEDWRSMQSDLLKVLVKAEDAISIFPNVDKK